MPDEANPDQKTSTVPPPSTPVPTEPPNSKPTFRPFCGKVILWHSFQYWSFAILRMIYVIGNLNQVNLTDQNTHGNETVVSILKKGPIYLHPQVTTEMTVTRNTSWLVACTLRTLPRMLQLTYCRLIWKGKIIPMNALGFGSILE